MKQIDFDFPAAKRAREDGKQLVEDHNRGFVRHMRELALEICARKGQVDCDQLRQLAAEQGLAPVHPNAWGSIFRGRQWRPIGWKASRLTTNHARMIRVWSAA